ncbi:MAG: ImmA/IrrE family metallo-endopeptidase [Ruminococcaceae bacterium]|nr:ImmA/IrrE family metallo-endopeptidase [Oscillospiraceae bacterium]
MNNRRELYRRVEEFRQAFHVGKGPVDVFAICEQIPGLELRQVVLKTHGFNGVYMRGESRDLILLNAARTRKEQMFDLSHELMHWWLHREKASHGRRDALKEWQANEGAAELLVPWKELAQRVYACRGALSSAENLRRFTTAQAQRCGVTEAVIRFRYESLRAELALARAGVKPSSLEVPGRWGISLNTLEAEQTGDRMLCAVSRR